MTPMLTPAMVRSSGVLSTWKCPRRAGTAERSRAAGLPGLTGCCWGGESEVDGVAAVGSASVLMLSRMAAVP